jgi:hypothetical protein
MDREAKPLAGDTNEQSALIWRQDVMGAASDLYECIHSHAGKMTHSDRKIVE